MKNLPLLPGHFKITGFVLISLAYILPVALGMLHVLPALSDWKQALSKTIFILGLFLIVLTREKVEDEFVSNCRLQAMAFAFAFSVTFYLCFAILSAFKVEVFAYSGFHVLFIQLAGYLLKFHLSIRGMGNHYA